MRETILKEIIPEATPIGGFGGKYQFKDWIICLPCNYVMNKKVNKRLMFHSDGDLKNILNLIKK